MRRREPLRVGVARLRPAGWLLLVAALAAGLWQCADDTLSSLPGTIGLSLSRGAGLEPSVARIDSVEIEIRLDGEGVAGELVAVDPQGGFEATFALPAAEDYAVRVFAYGAAGEAWPDGSRPGGVVARAETGGVAVPAGRLAQLELPLALAASEVLAVTGAPGIDSLRVRWSSVAGASAYRLAWYSARSGGIASSDPIADTTIAFAWAGPGALAGVAPSDSVLFRARPEFDGRGGVSGPGLWRDLSLWLDLPRLLSASPGPGDSIEAEGAAVELAFDRGMDRASLAAGVDWRRIGGDPVAFTAEALEPEPASRFRLEPHAMLAMGAPYSVTLAGAVTDADGRPFDADPESEGLQAWSAQWRTAAYAPLRVIAVEPAPGAQGVARDEPVRVRFNRAVDPASVGDASLYLTDAWGARLAAASITAAGDSARWVPAAPAWYATACTLHVTTGIVAADGKPFDQVPQTYPEREGYGSVFTTLAQPEGPRVVAQEPDSGAVAVPLWSGITVEFSEPVDPATVSPTTSLRLLRGGSVGIPGSVLAEAGDRRFTFRPNLELERGTAYLVRVLGEAPGGGVRDLDGHPLDQDRLAPGYQPYEAWLTAELPPAVVTLGFEPARADTFVATGASLLLTFSRTLDPASVTAATLRLEREGTPIQAAITLAPDGSARLDPPGALEWLTRYAIVADTLIAAADGSRLDQDPVAPRHQPFRRHFTTEPESLHPAVAVVSPADGAEGVSLATLVSIAFSRPIDPATVTTQSLLLEALGPGGEVTPVAGTVAAASQTATFTPASPLAYFSEYRVRVTTAVTDPSGLLPLDQDASEPGLQPFLSFFATTHERIPPRVESVYPANGAGQVSIATDVALLFSEPMDAASLAGAFQLRAAGEPVAGDGALDGTGRIYTFAPAQALPYLTACAVEVDTTARDLAGNALDGVPSQPGRESFASAFTTEPDRVSPRVALREPADGSQQVAPDQPLVWTFNERLARASLTPQAFRVEGGAGPLPGRAQLSADGQVLNWSPVTLPDSSAALLEFGTTYQVTADTLLADLAGNRLDQRPDLPGRQADVAFFATMPETLAPRVTALLPAAIDVPIEAHPALVFSEPMEEASLLEPAAVALTREGEPVAHARSLSTSGDTLTLVPEAPFEYLAVYVVQVETSALDLNGNRLDQDPAAPGRQGFGGSFQCEPDRDPPVVLSVSPLDGAVHVDPEISVVLTFSEPLAPNTVHGGSVYLVGEEGIVTLLLDPQLDESGTEVALQPAALVPGGGYEVVVTHQVTDVAGNEMEHAPGQPAFSSGFTVGQYPQIVWGGGLCAPSDTSRVVFDASASFDPAEDDSIAWARWDWGDGTRDTLQAPAGLAAAHTYGCLDLAGCDGQDNDGDGEADETGPEGCDESHRVILELIDAHGLARRDTVGVAFCPLLVLESFPEPGGRLSLHESVRLAFSRAIDAATVDTSVALYDEADSSVVACRVRLAEGGRELLLSPRGAGEGAYRLEISPLLQSAGGPPLDQDLCAPGRQGFRLEFLGPEPPEGEDLLEPAGGGESGP